MDGGQIQVEGTFHMDGMGMLKDVDLPCAVT